MNDLINFTKKETMTSLQIAEITGKEHKNVIRDIRTLLEQGVGQFNFEPSSYINSQNKSQPMYLLTKKGCLILASGYSALLREKIIDRWGELENTNTLPKDYLSALKSLVVSEEQKQALLVENKQQSQLISELQPKANYVDDILNNKGLVTITQIAKDYGMSGKRLNVLLNSLKVQYKQSGQWLLYHKYQDKGFTHSKTIDITHSDGRKDVKMETKWTQNGRMFIYKLLKKNDIIPIVEQDFVS